MGRKRITIDATDIIDAIRPLAGEIDGSYDLYYNLHGCVDVAKDGDFKPGYLYFCDLCAFDDCLGDQEEDLEENNTNLDDLDIADLEDFTGVDRDKYEGSDNIKIIIKDNL